MADDMPSDSSDKLHTEVSDIVDESLDFTSENFDPLKVLYAENIIPPIPGAKVFPTFARYVHVYKTKEKAREARKNAEQAGPSGLPPTTSSATTSVRRFLPHQVPTKSTRVFVERNVLTRMQNSTEGPLSLLKTCVDKRLRIKVLTRHGHGIRGYCIAFLDAFDKHWNLALNDVTEVWTRKKIRKIPDIGETHSTLIPISSARSSLASSSASSTKAEKTITTLGGHTVTLPRIVVKPCPTNKKLEICERHIRQFMMRGEHVVIINVLDK